MASSHAPSVGFLDYDLFFKGEAFFLALGFILVYSMLLGKLPFQRLLCDRNPKQLLSLPSPFYVSHVSYALSTIGEDHMSSQKLLSLLPQATFSFL